MHFLLFLIILKIPQDSCIFCAGAMPAALIGVPPSKSDEGGVAPPAPSAAGGVTSPAEEPHEAAASKNAQAMPLTIETVPAAMSPYMQNAEAQRICEASKVVDSGQQSALRALCSKAQREIWGVPRQIGGKIQSDKALIEALTAAIVSAAQTFLSREMHRADHPGACSDGAAAPCADSTVAPRADGVVAARADSSVSAPAGDVSPPACSESPAKRAKIQGPAQEAVGQLQHARVQPLDLSPAEAAMVVVDLQRLGSDRFLVKVADGTTHELDEAVLGTLPQGSTKLLTLRMRELAALGALRRNAPDGLAAENSGVPAENSGVTPPAEHRGVAPRAHGADSSAPSAGASRVMPPAGASSVIPPAEATELPRGPSGGGTSSADATPLTLESVGAAISPYQSAEAQRILHAAQTVLHGTQKALYALC